MEEVEQFVPPTREVGQINFDLMSVTNVYLEVQIIPRKKKKKKER